MACRLTREGMKLLTILAVSATSTGLHAATATGKASYYSHAGRTASGAIFDRNAMTAAHRTAPFGTKLTNQRTTVVTVTDRGPFIRGRIIDVSARAADVLGFRRAGVAQVAVEAAE